MIILIHSRLIEYPPFPCCKYFINTFDPHNNPVVSIFFYFHSANKETDAKKFHKWLQLSLNPSISKLYKIQDL